MTNTPSPDQEREAIARLIYDGALSLVPGWVPWVEGGNSTMQDEARRVAARIQSLRSAPEWRSLTGEAPKTGTFLAAYEDGTVVAAHYLDNSHTTHPFAGVRPLHGVERAGNRLVKWTPMPPPPTTNEGDRS